MSTHSYSYSIFSQRIGRFRLLASLQRMPDYSSTVSVCCVLVLLCKGVLCWAFNLKASLSGLLRCSGIYGVNCSPAGYGFGEIGAPVKEEKLPPEAHRDAHVSMV